MAHRLAYVYVNDPYAKLERLIEDEIDQQSQAGFDTEKVEKRFQIARERKDPTELEKLLVALAKLPKREGFPFAEPSDMAAIEAARDTKPKKWKIDLSDSELYDRIYGGWLGRCAGNCLGRPVENWTKEEIETRLRLTGSYPLSHYFPLIDPLPEGTPEWLAKNLAHQHESRDLLGKIDGMVRDDDIDYTILGLHILENYGPEFTTQHVGTAWLLLFPFRTVATAERVAYINLVNNMAPPECASYRNPYREWIGAQIRADMWGYVNPGDPAAAAEMAFRDAALSHAANGIYGEMAVAAMIASAFAVSDPKEILQAGISVIPKRSRLREALERSLEWDRRFDTWEEAWKDLQTRYGHYHPVHTINNAAVVALALLYGKGDFEKSITLSVMAGFDTDCNGATVGSLLGVLLGAEALPGKWIEPFHDRVESYVLGYTNSRISDLAKRTVGQYRRIANA